VILVSEAHRPASVVAEQSQPSGEARELVEIEEGEEDAVAESVAGTGSAPVAHPSLAQ
jgi:hypothetical protein